MLAVLARTAENEQCRKAWASLTELAASSSIPDHQAVVDRIAVLEASRTPADAEALQRALAEATATDQVFARALERWWLGLERDLDTDLAAPATVAAAAENVALGAGAGYGGDHVDFGGAAIYGSVTGTTFENHHHHGPAPTALRSLPAAPRTLSGRDDELDSLAEVLSPATAGGARSVAVAGLPGVGKTALALYAAHAAKDSGWFPGGTLFLDLHGYDPAPISASQALQALLRAMGVGAEHIPIAVDDQTALYHSVLDRLADQAGPVLVVLDNASSVRVVRPLLAAPAAHRTLITSRDLLPQLPAQQIRLRRLTSIAAKDLLRQALHIATPMDQRASEDENAADALADACGHLPLALQICAALLIADPDKPISELVEELLGNGSPIDHLDDGERDVRAALDLSYRRLPEDQARLLRLLAAAPGSEVTITTIAAIAGTPTPPQRLLEDLARTHLVERGRTRSHWGMHDLVRGFAQGVSESEGGLREEVMEARGRLLTFLSRRAYAADAHLQGSPDDEVADSFADRAEALAWLDAERASLVGAALWAGVPGREKSQTAQAVLLGACLAAYLNMRRYADDGAAVSLAALDAAIRLGDRYKGATADAWNNVGSALQKLRRFEEAVEAHIRARDLHTALGHQHGVARAWNNLGLGLQELRRFEEALEAHIRARDLHTALGHQQGMAAAWNNLGLGLYELGRFEEAVDAHARARDLDTTLGDSYGAAGAWNNLGNALQKLGRFEEAVEAHTRARDRFTVLGDELSAAVAWNNLGNALMALRRFDEALEAYRRDEQTCVRLGDWYGAGQTRSNIARLLTRTGSPSEVRTAWAATADAFTKAGADREAAEARSRSTPVTPDA